MKVGELYAELGLEDLVTRESKKVADGLKKTVAKMDDQVTLGLDSKELARQLDAAKNDVNKLRKEITEKSKLGVDTADLTLALTEAETKAKRLKKQLSEKVTAKLDADDSRLQAAAKASQGLLDDVAGGDYTAKVKGDVSGVDDKASEGQKSLVDMIFSWQTAAVGAAGAIGVAIGNTVVDSISEVLNRSKTTDAVAARLLISEEQAARIGRLASQTFLDNFGGSFAEVADAYQSALTTLPEGLAASDDELSNLVRRALTFSDLFSTDVPESILAAGALVKNGLARDTQEAFDIMHATLATTPEALWGDVFDVLTEGEYLTAFAQLGLSGEEAFTIIADAADGGSFMLDKAGDSLKEFTVRATDGSALTSEAFATIGLDADTMANRILEGGDTAKGAFKEIVDGLLGIEDPAARAQTAIALFGTPIEDLGPGQITDFLTSLSNMEGGLGDVEGAADRAGQSAYDNFLSKWDSALRNFDPGALADKFTREGLPGLKAQVAEGVDELTALWEEYGPAISELVGEGIEALGDLWDEYGPGILDAVGTWWDETAAPWISEKAGEALAAAAEGVWNRFTESISDPERLNDILEHNPMSMLVTYMGEKAQELIGAIPEWLGGVWESIENWFTGTAAPGIHNKLNEWLSAFGGWALSLAASLPGWLSTAWGVISGWLAGVPGMITAGAAGMWDGIVEAMRSAINAVIDLWNSLSIPSLEIGPWEMPTSPWTTQSVGPVTIGGFDLPDIPRLATGAWVPANSPMLAMIGDHPTAGEVVAPEPMLRQIIRSELGAGGLTVNGGMSFQFGPGTDERAARRGVAMGLRDFVREHS